MGSESIFQPMEDHQSLKNKIIEWTKEQGADLVGFARADTWDEMDEIPVDYRPKAIWPMAKSVIVMGLQMPLPMVDTTPSVVHMELYNTANRELDLLAYNLTRYLNRLGHASFFFPRDAYGSIKILLDNPVAAFSHVFAAKYAGLGTIGLNHTLLTPQFGPRVRLVSVFTSVPLPPDPMITKDLCTKCLACVKCCPVDALKACKDTIVGDYDKKACARHAEKLTHERRYPCGVCTKVCPIGQDRELYQSGKNLKKYLKERAILKTDPDNPEYKSWTHVRKHGSFSSDLP